MNENSYLNPASIAAQSAEAIHNLNESNLTLRRIRHSLGDFENNDQIVSQTFNTAKQRMADYVSLINLIKSANDSDIKDFECLMMTVGLEKLDGAAIINGKNRASSSKENNLSIAREYSRKSRSSWIGIQGIDLVTPMYFEWKAGQYRRLAEKDEALYQAWARKESAYDEIEQKTKNLFEASVPMRNIVDDALKDISGCLRDGKYTPNMNADWRMDLQRVYMDRLVSVSENGKYVINRSEVGKILRKKVDDILPEEYKAISYAFLVADEKDMEFIIKRLMQDGRKDVDYNIFSLAAGAGGDAYSEWTMDVSKAYEIEGKLLLFSEFFLNALSECKENGITIEDTGMDQYRKIILQRYTLMQTLVSQKVFRGDYQGEAPDISVKCNEKEQTIEIHFKEYRNIRNILEGALLAQPTFSNLADSKITITGTVCSTALERVVEENAEKALYGHFQRYSFGEDSASFLFSEMLDYVVSKSTEFILKDIIEFIPIAGDVIPIAGDVISFANETKMAAEQEKEDLQLIQEQFQSIYEADILADFGCVANFVYYDTSSTKGYILYPYAGENTREKLERINNNEEFNTLLKNSLSVEDLLLYNDTLSEFITKVFDDAKLLNIYDQCMEK